jgi:hypothetical protein
MRTPCTQPPARTRAKSAAAQTAPRSSAPCPRLPRSPAAASHRRVPAPPDTRSQKPAPSSSPAAPCRTSQPPARPCALAATASAAAVPSLHHCGTEASPSSPPSPAFSHHTGRYTLPQTAPHAAPSTLGPPQPLAARPPSVQYENPAQSAGHPPPVSLRAYSESETPGRAASSSPSPSPHSGSDQTDSLRAP